MKDVNEQRGVRSFLVSEYRNLTQFVKRYLNERYYNVSAEDVIQDVALNLFSKIDIDSQVENITGYVYRSLRNRISDIQRKQKKEILLREFADNEDDEQLLKTYLVNSSQPVKEIDYNLFYQKFYDVLEELSPNQQAVIIKTEIDGYTFEELAEEWEIPIGTLLSWKHRGIKKIKEIIKLDDFYIDREQK